MTQLLWCANYTRFQLNIRDHHWEINGRRQGWHSCGAVGDCGDHAAGGGERRQGCGGAGVDGRAGGGEADQCVSRCVGEMQACEAEAASGARPRCRGAAARAAAAKTSTSAASTSAELTY